ncbi:MAG: hypothetical protein JO323_02290 [Acidobacteriia bacterium]|nr:hypothetical protein [Terriglobia bacterium]
MMRYESFTRVDSKIAPGVHFTVWKMSYGRRADLMRRIRDLTRRREFLEASESALDKMDSALLGTEINNLYVSWGLRSIAGLTLDGLDATPELLVESGPEELVAEALNAVREQAGLTPSERKN